MNQKTARTKRDVTYDLLAELFNSAERGYMSGVLPSESLKPLLEGQEKSEMNIKPLHEAIEKAVIQLVRDYHIACDQLTEEQLAKAFTQALACGDFHRLVAWSGAQTVIYIPFAREQELQSEIDSLKRLCDNNGIDWRDS